MAILQGNAKQGSTRGFYPKTIEGSLRFNDDDSAYLSRTPASAGNQKTWTWSGWVKRGNIGAFTRFFTAKETTSNGESVGLRFDSSNRLDFIFCQDGSSSITGRLITTQVFRDTSAWYHIVFAQDTTASDGDKMRLWVNGSEVTQFDTETNMTTNHDGYVNKTVEHRLGAESHATSQTFDGYLAEVHFTDGTAYDADAFGEFKNGVWVAKTPSVTYGTNGFYLDFANSADIGNDVSGEGNDWTPNNFTASDVVLDSPTDNFCTWNPLNKGSAITLKDGNLSFTQTSTWNGVTGTVGVSSGKWYFEYTFGGGTAGVVGVAKPTYDPSTEPGIADTVWRYRSDDGTKRNGGASSSAYGATWTNGDVIGVAYDLDVGEIEFYKNGVSQGVAFTNLAGETVVPVAGTYNSTNASYVNFGQQPWVYGPPE